MRCPGASTTWNDVFISGSVDISTAVQAIKNGAVDFLQKPYPENKLLEAIYKALCRNAS
jgi:FixJ family two-component response regulator